MSAAVQERILAVARQQFLEAGFDRCSMDAVARLARVSKQSLYELFPTKLELFSAVLRDQARQARYDLTAVAIEGRDPQDVLADYVGQFFNAVFTLDYRGQFRALLVADRQLPSLAETLHQERIRAGTAIAAFFDTLVRKGMIRASAASSLVRRLGGTAVEGTRSLLGFETPSPETRPARARRFVSLIWGGYRQAMAHEVLPDDAAPTLPVQVFEPDAALRLSAERLDGLFRAATRAFVTHGFPDSNITRIAAEAGMSPATLYRQFGNKDGLFRRTILHMGQTLWPDASPEARPTPGVKHATAEDRLTALARWALDRHLNPDSLALQRLLITEAEAFPDLAQWAYSRLSAPVCAALCGILRQSDMPVPDPLLQRAFYTLATYGVRFVVAPSDIAESDRDALSRECAGLYLRGCAV